MRFIRVEDRDTERNRYNKDLEDNAEGQVKLADFSADPGFGDPYRLGELRLNNDSHYNNPRLKAGHKED